MSINLTQKAELYLKKENAKKLYIDIAFSEEPCTQIYEPSVEIIEDEELEKYNTPHRLSENGIILFISEWFKQLFGEQNEFKLDLKGLLKKKLVIKNIEPIIKNTCKVT